MLFNRKFMVLFVLIILVFSSVMIVAQEEETYTVRRGDTLRSIAAQHDTSWEAIAARNGLVAPSIIYPGQVLVIPNPGTNINQVTETYTVTYGDTLAKIAVLYNTTVEALADANNMTSTSVLSVGQVLMLPAQGGAVIAPGEFVPPPSPPRVTVNGWYTVQDGDTLFDIAREFEISVWTLAQVNSIYNLNYVFIGQQIYVPGQP